MTHRFFCALTGFLLAVVTSGAAAKPLETVEDVRALGDATLEALGGDDLEAMVGLLAPHWDTPREQLAADLRPTFEKRRELVRRFGERVGVEFIGIEVVGKSLARLTYLEKYAKRAQIWTLYLYRAVDEWKVFGATWHDQVLTLFGPPGATVR